VGFCCNDEIFGDSEVLKMLILWVLEIVGVENFDSMIDFDLEVWVL
jgi:hypothetical protein